jgi:hypothetical protein
MDSVRENRDAQGDGYFMDEVQVVNVAVREDRPLSLIGAERWSRAELATKKIIFQVQPTEVSEDRRRKVIDYVQRLITGCLGSQVFPYGSVPLKTYLPDGDIDLTAFGGANIEDALASDIVSVLEGEDQNPSALFIVKDVQLIRAEVRLVKCIVQNIAVDISFNQIGGLCTLCFLEQVDRFIGKDHLFKRSIILIKAWCYYESRILGAHHGLISTYALETLVLYIFHLFHFTLDGPLAVLYKFLDYFSKFDWDNYCVSLTGPIRVSSLPEIFAETPENGGGDLLLTPDFLRYCVDQFSVPSKGNDSNSRTFQPKHLNIVDPLKENNNLGRSVSKGNFYRIRSAFTYGARKLGGILIQSEDKNLAKELSNFFSNTLERHGSGQRPDVQDPVPLPNRIFYDPEMEASSQEENLVDDDTAHKGLNSKITSSGGTEMKLSRIANGHASAEPFHPSAEVRSRLSGDAEDLATSKIQSLKLSNYAPAYESYLHVSNGTVIDRNMDDAKPSENHESENDAAVSDTGGNVESLLSDLTGDYEMHSCFLQMGRSCYEYALNGPALHMPTPHFRPMNSWDPRAHQSSQFKHNGFSHNGVVPKSMFYPMNPLLIPPGVAFKVDDKSRGTGTYFPNMSRPPHGYKPSGLKGRNLGATVRSPRLNGRAITYMDYPVEHDGLGPISPDVHHIRSPRRRPYFPANGLTLQADGPDFVPAGHVVPLPVGVVPLLVPHQQGNIPPPPHQQGNIPPPHPPGMQRPNSVLDIDQDRITTKSSYHLKDDEDFPPLSGPDCNGKS